MGTRRCPRLVSRRSVIVGPVAALAGSAVLAACAPVGGGGQSEPGQHGAGDAPLEPTQRPSGARHREAGPSRLHRQVPEHYGRSGAHEGRHRGRPVVSVRRPAGGRDRPRPVLPLLLHRTGARAARAAGQPGPAHEAGLQGGPAGGLHPGADGVLEHAQGRALRPPPVRVYDGALLQPDHLQAQRDPLPRRDVGLEQTPRGDGEAHRSRPAAVGLLPQPGVRPHGHLHAPERGPRGGPQGQHEGGLRFAPEPGRPPVPARPDVEGRRHGQGRPTSPPWACPPRTTPSRRATWRC